MKIRFIAKKIPIYYIILLFLTLFFLSFKMLYSNEILLNCNIQNVNKINNKKNLPELFRKKINIYEKEVVEEKFLHFDKIVHYGENEIILTNNIYETYSVYDLNSNIWTTYDSQSILIYKCSKQKSVSE